MYVQVYNYTTVFLNGIYSYCDIAVLIILTDFLYNVRKVKDDVKSVLLIGSAHDHKNCPNFASFDFF